MLSSKKIRSSLQLSPSNIRRIAQETEIVAVLPRCTHFVIWDEMCEITPGVVPIFQISALLYSYSWSQLLAFLERPL